MTLWQACCSTAIAMNHDVQTQVSNGVQVRTADLASGAFCNTESDAKAQFTACLPL
jgi:hypothetical protein